MNFTQDWFSHNIPTWERFVVPRMRAIVEPRRFLEVGTFEGRSAFWTLKNLLTWPDDVLTCVDSFYPRFDDNADPDYEKRFLANLDESGEGRRVRILVGESGHVLRQLYRDAYHGIYLDGAHDAPRVLQDLVLSWDLLQQDGILIVDDYGWDKGRGVAEATDAFLKIFETRLDIVHKGYQVMVQKR